MKNVINPDAMVHASAKLEAPVHIEHYAEMQRNSKIGRYSYLSPNAIVGKDTVIGRFCSIARYVNLGAPSHPMDWMSTSSALYQGCYHFRHVSAYRKLTKPDYDLGPNTVIGNDVWIGSGVTVLRGVTVGDGAILAGGAFVNKDVAPYEIVAGLPAKPMRKRFDDATIARFMAVKWWDMDLPDLEGIPFDQTEKALDMLEALRDKA